MRHRAALILVMLLAIGVRAIPCEAMANTAEARHDCCEQHGCPDMVTTDSGHHAGPHDSEGCCALAESRHEQQSSRALTVAFTVAAPVRTIDFAYQTAPSSEAPPETSTGPSRSAPLHLLFSVLLI